MTDAPNADTVFSDDVSGFVGGVVGGGAVEVGVDVLPPPPHAASNTAIVRAANLVFISVSFKGFMRIAIREPLGCIIHKRFL